MPYLELSTSDQLKDIYNEFNTSEEAIKKDVQSLMEWLEQTPHLPPVKDEEFLANFLLRCKNSMEKTKTLLDYYYSCKTLMPEIFAHRDPATETMKKCIFISCLTPLPKLTAEGYRVIAYRIFEHDTKNLPSVDVQLSSYQIQYDILVKADKVKGFIMIFDFEHLSFAMAAQLMTEIRKNLEMMEKITKNRFKKIYVVHLSPAVEQMLKIAKSILKKKLADRIEVWNKKATDLVEVLPKHILPSNYGGDERSMEELRHAWYEYIMEFRDWLVSQQDVKADLSRRPKDSHFDQQLSTFGVEGSFRKIAID